VHTAPLDELVGVVQELVAASPDGINLDTVANALRERGFRRKAGSPRLITRLRLIKDIEVARDGKIRLASGATPAPAEAVVDEPLNGAASDDAEPSGDGNGGGNGRRRRRRGGRRRRGRGASDQAADGAAAT
jgi:ribonuclease E